MRILMAGGGTGGHISPILAVIEELKRLKKGIEILYVGSKRGMEEKIIPQTGIDYQFINAGKFRRYHKNIILNILDPLTIIRNIIDFFKFIFGIFDSFNVLTTFHPDVVFIKGGYVGLPIGIAATVLRIPLVIHESDSIFGLANKILLKFTNTICVSYPEDAFKDIILRKRQKLVFTGNPVRSDIIQEDKELAHKVFEFKKDIPTLMIIGGSQGSHIINLVISEILEDLLDKYQVIHVSGEKDFGWLQFLQEKFSSSEKEKYKLFSFLTAELKDAYAASDLVISRAGANVLAELTILGKPSILIPLGTSASAHQFRNAQIVSRKGAAYLLPEFELSKESLLKQIDLLFEKPGELDFLSKKALELAKFRAAEFIAKEILELKQSKK